MSLANAEVWPGRACTGHWTAGTACTSLSSKSSLVQLVKSQPFLQLELEQKLQGDDDHDPAADSVGHLLAAGTVYYFKPDSSWEAYCHDFTILLGPFFCAHHFPTYGGRHFVAGKLQIIAVLLAWAAAELTCAV